MSFFGNIDWQRTVRELKNCNYSGFVTMEIVYRNGYMQTGIDSFYKKSYEAGEKLKKMFEAEQQY